MIPAQANTQDDLALTIDGAAVRELLYDSPPGERRSRGSLR